MKRFFIYSMLITIIMLINGCGGSVSEAVNDALSGLQGKHVNEDIIDNKTTTILFNVSTNYKTITNVPLIVLDIKHQRMGDLKIELTDPSGTTVILSHYRGGNNSVDGISFEYDAPTSVVNFNNSTKEYKPEEDISKFTGDKANGIWVLKIRDSVNNSKTGKITRVALIINGVK